MPNWVYNRLTVYGEPEQLEAFRAKAEAPTALSDREGFSFANFIRPADEELENYLDKGWYDWNSRNWGTKWDAHEADLAEEGDDYIEYTFDTAWADPRPVYEAMVTQHPELRFFIHYSEEQGWGGEYQSEDGKLAIVDEWEIPETHEDFLERRGYCHCEGMEEPADWMYDDCPIKQIKQEVTV